MQKSVRTVELVASRDSKRLDALIAEETGLTRSHVKKLTDDGLVFVCGKAARASRAVKAGEKITFTETIEPLDAVPEDIPIDIIYEDDDIAVINKPQGMTVHAGGGTKNRTLVNALLFHLDNLSGIGGVIRPGIVHRIDKDTSGLLVVAKNDAAHVSLAAQIAEKSAHRIYNAVLEGVVKEDEGTIKTFIARSEKNRKAMAVSDKGKLAVTHFKVLERFKENTLCEFSLETGRTHQIRVHAKYMGHPVVGDRVYGYKKQRFDLQGQLLHAKTLVLTHPKSGERMTFEAPLPERFSEVLEILRRESKKS